MIEIQRGFLGRLHRESPDGSWLIQVKGAEDTDAVSRALRSFRDDLYPCGDDGPHFYEHVEGACPGPKMVTDPMMVPTGPMLFIDPGALPEELIDRVPEWLTARLLEEGITNAKVVIPKTRNTVARLSDTYGSPSVWMCGYLPRLTVGDHPIPDHWLPLISEFLAGEEGSPITLDIYGVEVALEDRDVLPVSRTMMTGADAGVAFFRKISRDRWRFAWGYPTLFPEIALGLYGSDLPELDAEPADTELWRLARRVAELGGYAFLTVEAKFPTDITPHSMDHWDRSKIRYEVRSRRDSFPAAPEVVTLYSDQVLFDAMPAQILGPKHLARLGANAPSPRQIAPDRWELILPGPLQRWHPDASGARDLLRNTRRVLGDLVMSTNQVQMLNDPPKSKPDLERDLASDDPYTVRGALHTASLREPDSSWALDSILALVGHPSHVVREGVAVAIEEMAVARHFVDRARSDPILSTLQADPATQRAADEAILAMKKVEAL